MPRVLGLAAGRGPAPESLGSIHGRFPPRRRCSLHRKLTNGTGKRLASNGKTGSAHRADHGGLIPTDSRARRGEIKTKTWGGIRDAEWFSFPTGTRSFPDLKKKNSRRVYSTENSAPVAPVRVQTRGWFGLAASPTSRNARLLPLSVLRAAGRWSRNGRRRVDPGSSASSVSSQDGVRRGVRSRRRFPLISPNGWVQSVPRRRGAARTSSPYVSPPPPFFCPLHRSEMSFYSSAGDIFLQWWICAHARAAARTDGAVDPRKMEKETFMVVLLIFTPPPKKKYHGGGGVHIPQHHDEFFVGGGGGYTNQWMNWPPYGILKNMYFYDLFLMLGLKRSSWEFFCRCRDAGDYTWGVVG